MGTSQAFFEGTYQLWQTVVMDTSAQRCPTTPTIPTAASKINCVCKAEHGSALNVSGHVQTISSGTWWVFPWFSRWRSSDSAARLVIPQLVEPATNLPSLPSNIKGVVSRIAGSASIIVELAMFGYDPFSNTPKYHCNFLDFCHIIISSLHPHDLLAM